MQVDEQRQEKPGTTAVVAMTTDSLHLWAGLAADTDQAAETENWVQSHLAASRACITDLLAVTGARSVENTLTPYDRAGWHLRMAGSQAHVMFMVHPKAVVRDAAQTLSQAVSAAGVALSLNQDVFHALQAVDASRKTRRRTIIWSARCSATDLPAWIGMKRHAIRCEPWRSGRPS